MTTTKRENIAELVGKLLNLADDQAGTPEGDLCQQRAFALLAKHGISESEARGTTREGANVVECLTFRLKGRYLRQQIKLLTHISRALHCETVFWARRGVAKVYGVKVHTSRVRLLFAILNPQMLAGAAKAMPPYWSGASARSYRIDWMAGYYTQIYARLSEAEQAAAHERDTETNTTTHALVLVSDADRAIAAKDRAHPTVKPERYKRTTYAADAVDKGRAAAERASLNQSEITGERRSITAARPH
ncbi:hypothetical protein [Nocardia carnea]|uniref:hypothetical protein n=1 Tax=Nocardia carnea TaxID=37328 RepID=UPI000304D48F|nr:hypothetical protein [Nocardia carnea]